MCGRRNASAAKKRFDFSLRYTNVADKISSPSEKDTTPQSYIFVVRKLGNVGEKKTRFRYEFPLLPPFRGGGGGQSYNHFEGSVARDILRSPRHPIPPISGGSGGEGEVGGTKN